MAAGIITLMCNGDKKEQYPFKTRGDMKKKLNALTTQIKRYKAQRRYEISIILKDETNATT